VWVSARMPEMVKVGRGVQWRGWGRGEVGGGARGLEWGEKVGKGVDETKGQGRGEKRMGGEMRGEEEGEVYTGGRRLVGQGV